MRKTDGGKEGRRGGGMEGREGGREERSDGRTEECTEREQRGREGEIPARPGARRRRYNLIYLHLVGIPKFPVLPVCSSARYWDP